MLDKFMYKYDIHVHTSETSRCGRVPAREMVESYARLGYAGICITDHLYNEFLERTDSADDWQKCVDNFVVGFNAAKRAGESAGLDVLFGVELRFPENDSDYLIYGIDEAWLRNSPFICQMNHESFFAKYGGEALIIHAHPFRKNDLVYYDSVHGLEIANCNPRHDSRNDRALELAFLHPHLIRTCGGDAHHAGDEGRAAMLFDEKIKSSSVLRDKLIAGAYDMWCPDFEYILEKSRANPTEL